MTAAEIIDLIKNVGFPIAVAAFVLYRMDARLADVVKALEALNDPDKTAARLRPMFEEQARKVVAEVGHDTRAALQPMMTALTRRDGP